MDEDSVDRLSFSYCFDIFQALTWTNYYYTNFTDGDRQVMWHAQDHMSSLCQSEKLHLDLSVVRLLLLALHTPDCKHHIQIDFACVLSMPTNSKFFEQIKETKKSLLQFICPIVCMLWHNVP